MVEDILLLQELEKLMETNIKLGDIFIGKADGSDESQLDDFSNLFYRGNNKYDELAKSTNKFIITGRKGTGKTILAKYHEAEQIKKGYFAKTITKDDVILKRLIEVGNNNLSREQQKLFIKYAVLTEIGQLIVQNEDKCRKNLKQCKDRRRKKELKKNFLQMKRVLYDRYHTFDNITKSPISETVSKENLVEGSLVSQIISKIQTQFRSSHTKNVKCDKSDFITLISSFEDKISLLTEYNPITLIFDDLDEYDTNINEEYINFLVDFIGMAKKINQNVLKKNKLNNKVILLIRQEILSSLNSNSNNLSKLVQDSTIYLNWFIKMNGKPHENPLIDLVLTKIQRSNQKFNECTKEELYNLFFPERILKKYTLNFLYENSFGRPRDIVNYLEIIRQEYPGNTRFDAECFIAMETRYSNRFLEELQNELYIHYPRGYINECIKVFELLHRVTFKKEHIEAILEQNSKQFLYLADANTFISSMYRFGAIGMRVEYERIHRRTKNKVKEYKFFWGYREDGKKTPDFNAEFMIHYGLKKSLIG